MKTVLSLKNDKLDELPPEFRDDDVRFSESFARHFIEHFTEVSQVVFDPFAGFGTTLLVAEAIGRIPFGLEFEQRRVNYVQTKGLWLRLRSQLLSYLPQSVWPAIKLDLRGEVKWINLRLQQFAGAWPAI